MLRTAIVTAALVGLSATAASAQDGGVSLPDGFGLEFGAGTDNRSKNASKTNGEAYAYGIVDWAPATGDVYVSGSIEGVDSNGADWESRLLVGWAPQFAGFDFDINAAHKWLIDAVPGADDDAWEFTANMSRSIGPASARLQYQYSPDAHRTRPEASAGSRPAWAGNSPRAWKALRPSVGGNSATASTTPAGTSARPTP